MLQLLEISLAPLIEVGIHHTSHFLTGFMALPRGQTKSLAKSGLLEKGPWKLNVMIATCFEGKKIWLEVTWTRNIPGLCAPVLILFSRDLFRYFEHHVLAALGKLQQLDKINLDEVDTWSRTSVWACSLVDLEAGVPLRVGRPSWDWFRVHCSWCH